MKKLILAIVVSLTTAMLLTFGVSAVDFSVSPAATGEVLGDANGDGAVNAMDVLFVKRYAANVQPSVEVGADANCDGRINAMDVLAMKRHAAEIQDLSELSKDTVKILAVDGVNVKNMAIVAPEGTSIDNDNSAYAADQLRKYLRIGAGYERSVEFGTPSTEHAIYVICDPTWDGESWYGGELGTEDFIIEVRDGNVYITGGFMRGCMYGVYEFLEEYVGWRFLVFEDCIYDADIINLKSGIYDHQTANLNFRHCGFSNGNNEGFKLKLNSFGGNYAADKKVGYVRNNLFSNAHSYAYYRDDMWPMLQGQDEEYDKRLQNLTYSWQPCFTEQYDEMFRGLLRLNNWVIGWGKLPIPGQVCMSFSIEDNENYCTCAGCKEKYARLGVSGASIEFASRAADDIQDYYPGMQIYTILYEHTPPAEGLYVSDNLVIMYCGFGCNNHIPGSGECGDGRNSLPLKVTGAVPNYNNNLDEESFPAWCRVCENVRFWAYEVTYMRNLAPCPNVLNIYGDIKFVIDSGGVGVNHEAGGGDYGGGGNYLEQLKAYIAARVMWDTDMTEEQCRDIILEYLYFRFGDGYEEIYRLIELMDEAGNGVDCFINNHDYPMEMYSLEVLDRQYEEIFSLVETARAGAKNSDQLNRFDKMSMHLYFLALSGGYDRLYVNGDAGQRDDYAAKYEYMYNYLKDNNIPVFYTDAWKLPDTCNLDKNPMNQFYGTGYSGQR